MLETLPLLVEFDGGGNIKVLLGVWLMTLTAAAGEHLEKGWKLAGPIHNLPAHPEYHWMVTLVKDNHV